MTSTHISCLLFAHLLRFSSKAKTLARSIIPPSPSAASHDTGNFFVPADGGAPPVQEPEPEDDEPPQSLLQILSEHLSLAFLSRTRADTPDREAREWDRLIVGYLTLLVQWLWEDPGSVRDFLNAGGLGMVSSAYSCNLDICAACSPSTLARRTHQSDGRLGSSNSRSLFILARHLV